jgi:hypothetical protein
VPELWDGDARRGVDLLVRLVPTDVLPGPRVAVITCALCGSRMVRSSFCSDLAVLVLHWMSEHPVEYARGHPESAPYLVPTVVDG